MISNVQILRLGIGRTPEGATFALLIIGVGIGSWQRWYQSLVCKTYLFIKKKKKELFLLKLCFVNCRDLSCLVIILLWMLHFHVLYVFLELILLLCCHTCVLIRNMPRDQHVGNVVEAEATMIRMRFFNRKSERADN
jgi:hypothetical protein